MVYKEIYIHQEHNPYVCWSIIRNGIYLWAWYFVIEAKWLFVWQVTIIHMHAYKQFQFPKIFLFVLWHKQNNSLWKVSKLNIDSNVNKVLTCYPNQFLNIAILFVPAQVLNTWISTKKRPTRSIRHLVCSM